MEFIVIIGYNYNTATGGPLSKVIQSYPLQRRVSCPNCYAYLTVGFEFEFDFSVFDGLKTFKSIFYGRSGVNFDPVVTVSF